MGYGKTELARHLRSLREKRGVTQGDVAAYLSINRTTYTKYEIDHTPNPQTIIKIAEFYSMTLDEMFKPLKKSVSSAKVVAASPEYDEGFGEISSLSSEEKRLVTLFRACDRPQEVLRIVKEKMVEDRLNKGDEDSSDTEFE